MSFLYIPMSRGSNGSNTFVGVGALQNVTTGVDNSAFGFYALNALVSGNRNTAVGSEALLLNTSSNNTAVGSGALRGSTTGQNNVALGQDAMRAGNPNNSNVAVGYSAMYNCGLTENSVGIGQFALYNAAGTIGNTAVGNTAGLLITTGSKNTILGAFNGNQGGVDIRTSNNYCVISDGDGNPRITDYNGSLGIGSSYAAPGLSAFAASIGNNSGTYGGLGSNGVALGYLARAQTYSFAAGYTPNASASWSVAIGYGASASASGSTAIGANWNHGAPTCSASGAVALGDGVTADAAGSFAYGSAAITNGIVGKQAFSNGKFASVGDSQSGKYVLRMATTSGVATAMSTNGLTAGASNQIILPNNTAMSFSGTVVVRLKASAGSSSAAWQISGLIRREANAASTTLVASTVTVISNVIGVAIALSADTTNGGLAVTVTGTVFTDFRWVANIDTAEVTYA